MTEGGDPNAHAIRPGHVQGFLYWRRTRSPDRTKREALTARSLAKDRPVLHSVFALSETIEVVPSNPVSKVEKPKGDAREPIILGLGEPGQYERLLRACTGRPARASESKASTGRSVRP